MDEAALRRFLSEFYGFPCQLIPPTAPHLLIILSQQRRCMISILTAPFNNQLQLQIFPEGIA
jgi:hypothetical protein